ncbi:hypothetical protein [Pseudonocardia sp. NPDC049154]|uniref:hypothetical protein n=1 Tax=Pseudonocardia sp. NPDC049154 TaxID=3155501 RepID=UPI0033F2D830
MALLKPMYMQPASGDAAIQYSAQDDRAGLLSSIFSREGVLDVDAGQLKVTQRAAGANFSVDVAAGRAAIQGDDVSDQGVYLCTSSTILNKNTFSTGGSITAPGSGSRTHRVIARVRDKLHNGSFSTYEWVIEILQDTGSGVPAVPASAISLATITIAAGASSITNAMITDTRPQASVGSKNREGTFALDPSLWNVNDPLRPGTWQVNANGWVSLAGQMYRKANFTYTANTQYTENAIMLPELIRPSTTRDFIGITSQGPVHWAVNAAGELKQRYNVNTTFTANVSWLSFDGCGYRI